MGTDFALNTEYIERFRKFRLLTFLNSVPEFSEDKRGRNIAILVAQTIILLKSKQFEAVTAKAENLSRYATRYVNHDENYRSNLFIKMLVLMAENHCDYMATQALSKDLHEKLATASPQKASKAFEMVPYENLWTVILSVLKEHSKDLDEELVY
jgi:hypothetical protein